MTLHLGPDLSLPLDAATDSNGILAKKGAGKSNAAVVLAEEMHDAGIPWVTIDPKGDWWGVRSSADGKAPGLPIVVFGGKHGDVPLEASAGGLVADLILGDDDRGYLSCVLDVSQFTISEQRRFLLDFGERLFRRKDEERVLHLFLEEAHEYLPQSVPREATKLVSTWQRIVKQGRFKGLGVTLVSQRSAALNKDVLTQVDSLFVLRVLSPQDRAAVKGWVEVHAGASEILGSLHELAPGEAWLWSPERLDEPTRFQFRRRRTFDSGATPKVGQTRVAPRTVADVDLGAVKDAMAETIEKAKAEDPRELRKRIRELEQQLATAPVVPESIVERLEVPVLTDADRSLIDQFVERWDDAYDRATEIVNTLRDALRRVELPEAAKQGSPSHRGSSAAAASVRPDNKGARLAPSGTATEKVGRGAPETRPDASAGRSDTSLTKAQRAILTAIVQRPGSPPAVVGFLARYSPASSTFRNAVGGLRAGGLVAPGTPLYLADEAAAVATLGGADPLPEGSALLSFWLDRLDRAASAMLSGLVEVHPLAADREWLAEQGGYSAASSTFRNAIGRLRSLQLCVRGQLRATDEFMAAIR